MFIVTGEVKAKNSSRKTKKESLAAEGRGTQGLGETSSVSTPLICSCLRELIRQVTMLLSACSGRPAGREERDDWEASRMLDLSSRVHKEVQLIRPCALWS